MTAKIHATSYCAVNKSKSWIATMNNQREFIFLSFYFIHNEHFKSNLKLIFLAEKIIFLFQQELFSVHSFENIVT